MLGVTITRVGGSAAPFDINEQDSHDLTLLMKGGAIRKNGIWGTVSEFGVLCGADVTTYIEVDVAGVVSSNTTSFTAEKSPLYKVTSNATAFTAVEDWRTVPNVTLPYSASIEDATGSGGGDAHTQLNLLLAELRAAKFLAPLP